jgi:hypothetical protein
MAIILVTQEAEIRKIADGGQPRQKARPHVKNTQPKEGLKVWFTW